MKRINPLLVILMLLVFASCNTQSRKSRSSQEDSIAVSKDSRAEISLDSIKSRGYITAIMGNSSTSLFLYKGKTMGYEYELLQNYAKWLGVDLRINVTTSIEEGFQKLERGEGDLLAYNLTVTKERKKRIAFTNYHNLVRSVLIQRKPDGWRQMKLHEIESAMIRNTVDLIDKTVYVRHSSAYLERLQHLSDEIGGDINIVVADASLETEELIRRVAEGEIDYTVADEDIALVNAKYYGNIDVKTPVSFPQQIAWGVRQNNPILLSSLNEWIAEMKRTVDYYVIYDKYFKSTRASLRRARSEYYTLNSGELSPYDETIKKYADDLGWDWRLLAAQIFKESKFDAHAKSWAGAMGLMQLLPVTAAEYGIEDLYNAEDNIYAGTRHLLWLQNYWRDKIIDSLELQKFVLASYNVGHGHVTDAMKLAEKNGANPQVWEGEVEAFLLKKSNSNYYNDPVVKYGYCRGIEPVTYVKKIYEFYDNYCVLLPITEADSLIENSDPQF